MLNSRRVLEPDASSTICPEFVSRRWVLVGDEIEVNRIFTGFGAVIWYHVCQTMLGGQMLTLMMRSLGVEGRRQWHAFMKSISPSLVMANLRRRHSTTTPMGRSTEKETGTICMNPPRFTPGADQHHGNEPGRGQAG